MPLQPIQVLTHNLPLKEWKAGFIEPKFHYFSWIISALQAQKYEKEPILFTSTEGANLFVDILKLPYQKVITNWCKSHPEKLTSYPKIKACEYMNDPFIFIEGDFIMWKKQSDLIDKTTFFLTHESDITCNFDLRYNYPLYQAKKHFNIPTEWDKQVQRTYKLAVYGGTNIDVFKKAGAAADIFINNNFSSYDYNLLKLNPLIDAWNIAIFDNDKGYCLYEEYQNPEAIALQRSITHIGSQRRSKSVCNKLEQRMKKDFPEYYERLIKWLL